MKEELLNEIENDLRETIKRKEQWLDIVKGSKKTFEQGTLIGLKVAMYIINLNKMLNDEK